MKFIKNTIFATLVAFYPFISFSADADSKPENPAKEWVYNPYGNQMERPANFYRIEKSLEDSICNEVLEKLNEKASINSDNSKRTLLIQNSALLKWNVLKDTQHTDGLEYIEYKVNGYYRVLYKYLQWLGEGITTVSYSSSLLDKNDVKNWQITVFKEKQPSYFNTDDLRILFPNYIIPLPKDQDINVMSLGQDGLYVLLMLSEPHESCDKDYDILVRLLTEGQSSPALCHIRSVSKIQCIKNEYQ